MWLKVCPSPLYLLKTPLVSPQRAKQCSPPPLILTGPKGEGGVSPTFLGAAGLGGRPSSAGCRVHKGTIP